MALWEFAGLSKIKADFLTFQTGIIPI